MTGFKRRASDRPSWASTTLGVVLCGAGLGLHAYRPTQHSDTLTITIIVIGACLVSPGAIRDLVRAWRAKNGATGEHRAP